MVNSEAQPKSGGSSTRNSYKGELNRGMKNEEKRQSQEQKASNREHEAANDRLKILESKYKKFKTDSEPFTKEKLSVFMNYWIADLLIDCFMFGTFNDNELIREHVEKLLNTFFERLESDEDDNDELITAFNHLFFEKIHKKLHFSRGAIKDHRETFLGQKEVISKYVTDNILKSNLIREFVLDSIQNVGGSYSKRMEKRNVRKDGIFSDRITETNIIPFKLITILKFNHIPYLEQIYDFNTRHGKTEIKEKITIDDSELRRLEALFIFKNMSQKCEEFAKFVTSDAKSDKPNDELTAYNTQRTSHPMGNPAQASLQAEEKKGEQNEDEDEEKQNGHTGISSNAGEIIGNEMMRQSNGQLEAKSTPLRENGGT